MLSGNAKALADRRQGRRWRFGSAIFDENSWTLSVGGHRVPLEARPTHLLHELLLQAGNVVTKDQLLEAVWPGVSVVEASLPTAVRKLRRALGGGVDEETIIETLPRVGYRLAIPVDVELVMPPPAPLAAKPFVDPVRAAFRRLRAPTWAVAAVAVSFLSVGGFVVSSKAFGDPPASVPGPVSRQEVMQALRGMDTAALHGFMRRGWDPNTPLDEKGDVPMGVAIEVCEWDPGHDPKKLMLLVRMLMDSGARVETRNAFGDTPYSIAKADRFCGPDHPVTRMLQAVCYSGSHNTLRDKCLASYE